MNTKLMTGTGMALLLGACAIAPPPNADLERARAAVQAAEADANVTRYAQLDLDAARKDLAAAENAYANHQAAAVPQPAYLATQEARVAQAHAAAKADDARVAQGQGERDRIMLQARTREADNAKQSVSNAKQEVAAANEQAAAASEQATRAQSELDQLKAQSTARGAVISLGDLMFDTGRANLKTGGTRKLDQLAQFLTAHPSRRVQVDGFTDSVGSDELNNSLSQQRAESVKAALLDRGVEPGRISAEGYGKAFPVASNDNAGGRQLNRRVEVVIGNDNGQPIAPRS